MIKAVLFDFDGVLADSLSPHVEFCYNMARRFGLRLKLPALGEGKTIAATPMDNFLRCAGFPEEVISVVLENHYPHFGENYEVNLFLDVDALLVALSTAGMKLAIVSSNKKDNVVAILGEGLASLFSVILGLGDFQNKADGIRRALEMMGVNPGKAVYVGDTEKDWEAAQAAGVRFIGVSYGWQIEADDPRFSVADNITALSDMLFEMD